MRQRCCTSLSRQPETFTRDPMFSIPYPIVRAVVLFVTLFANSALAQDSTLFYQDFDEVLSPALPTGWRSIPSEVWSTSSSVAGPGSGQNNIVVSGSDSGAVVTPLLDLSLLSSGVLSYSARRTSTFDSVGVIVEASLDGGKTFTIVILDSALALPGIASTYEEISAPVSALLGQSAVQIRFRAIGNSGGNCRIDDVKIVGVGEVRVGEFGFSQISTSTVSGSDSVEVNLSLEILASVGSLYGLQFDLGWSSETSVIGVERGAAVSDPATWDLAAQLGSNGARIVLLGKTDFGLSAGSYPNILTLLVAPVQNDSSSTRLDTLSIRGVIGSRSEDTGDDAYITAGILTHVISVVRPTASFEATVDSLDFGLIATDSVARQTLGILNPTGTVPLEVFSVTSDNPAITVSSSSFSTDPGDTTVVMIDVDATQLGPGPFAGHVTFVHNGASSPDSIRVIGRIGALNTRGDVNDDGLTDLLDLVLAVDHVIGKIVLPAGLAERIDLYPFPTGDGSADVRDLTILVRAINRGVWPDGELLPSPVGAAKGQSDPVASLYVSDESGVSVIRVSYSAGLRAIQLVFALGDTDRDLRPQDFSVLDHGSLVQTHIDRYRGGSNGFVGLLAYALDGPLTEDPEFSIAGLSSSVTSDSLRLIFATGVDLANRRVVLEFNGLANMADGSLPRLLPAFPQPFSLSSHRRVRIASELPGTVKIDVRITDVLGRTVFAETNALISGRLPYSWDGKSKSGRGVSPGVYFVTLTTVNDSRTVPVVVAR